ncbi:MAG: carbohydrate ABC transporter substrate-binding protein [Oscillospiraceae bacterium]|nr:carbohydrate ABC transporter substrate-binding protein [Oscillospiraceae bacterium]
MKQSIKKNLFVITVISAIFLLVSCGIFDNSDDNTLTIIGKKNDLEKSYIISIFDRYREATGNKLNIISFEDSEYETETLKRFQNGKGSDIFMHFHNSDLYSFDVENNFLYLNDEEWVDDLTDSARNYCTDKNGNLLGLPFWESSVSGCYYNKTLLAEMGLKPAATQAEFDVLCQAIAATGYTPICRPTVYSWMIQFAMDPIFADNPELLEKLNNNEISYSDIPEMIEMVKWVENAADKGWFGYNYTEKGWDDISDDMSSGKAVMTFIWDTWFYTDFEKGNKYSTDDFALMPVFLNTAHRGTYEGGNMNMMMVNKNSKKLDLALDFLAFCASEENYNAAFDGIPTVSCFKGQTTNIQSKQVTDAAASIAENERVSTAASRIAGYSADDVTAAFDSLFRKKTDAAGCLKLMDDYRIEKASKQEKQ